MPKLFAKRLSARRCTTIALGVLLATAGAAALPAISSANSSQVAIFQDNSDLVDPAGAFAQFRELGANTVRVIVPWSQIAPSPGSKKKPNFNATDPSAYPRDNWAPYDAIVREAKRLWADGRFHRHRRRSPLGRGRQPAEQLPVLRLAPEHRRYGQFFQAVGERYDGHFTAAGQSSPLPAVHFWAIYNEPNFGEDLGPQASNDSTVASGPAMFRGLLNAGCSALQRTGHGHDTIVWGELAAEGFEPGPNPRRTAGLPG